MSILTSLFRRLGIENADRAFRSIALDIFRTPKASRADLLNRAVREAGLAGVDEVSTRATWNRILASFDNAAATNPERMIALERGLDAPRVAAAPDPVSRARARLPEPGGAPTGGAQQPLPFEEGALGPAGLSPEEAPLDFLLQRVEDDLLRGAPTGSMHPRFIPTLKALRSGRNPRLADLSTTPHRPVPLETRFIQARPTTPQEEAARVGEIVREEVRDAFTPTARSHAESVLAHKRDELHTSLFQVLNTVLEDNPALRERFPSLSGAASDVGDQISGVLNEIGRIFTEPIPAGPGAFDRVKATAFSVARNLGITDKKALRSLADSAAAERRGLRAITPNIGDDIATRAQTSIDRLTNEAAELRLRGGTENLRLADRLDSQAARLEKRGASAAKSATLESAIDIRVRFADALVDAVVEPLTRRDRRTIRRLTQFILFERGDIKGSAPRLQLPQVFDSLFAQAGIRTPREATRAAGRQAVAAGIRTTEEAGLPTSRTFREFFTGTGSTQIRAASSATLKSAPRSGAIVRTRPGATESAFVGAQPDPARARGEVIPPHIRNADELVVIDIVEARQFTGRPASATQAATEAAEKLAAARDSGVPAKQLRSLEAAAFQARVAAKRAAQARRPVKTGPERTFPAAIVAPVDRPDLAFVLELKQLQAVRPPNPTSRKLATDARSTIASFSSPSTVFADAARKAGVAITAAPGEPTAYNIRRPGMSHVEFTADPATAASAQLEPGVVIERVTGATPYQAARLAAERALAANKQLFIATRVRSLADELGETSRGGFALADLILSTQQDIEATAAKKAAEALLTAARRDVTTSADIIVTQMLRDVAPRMHLIEPFSRKLFATAPTTTLAEADKILRSNVRRVAKLYNLKPETAEFRIGSFGDGDIDPRKFTTAALSKEKIRQLADEAEAPLFYLVGENIENQTTIAVVDMTAMGRVGLLRDPQLEATQAAYKKLEASGNKALKGLCPTEEI